MIWRQFIRLQHNGPTSLLVPTIKSILNNPNFLNSKIRANGHIRSVRKSKKVIFLDIADGSDYRSLNVVLPESVVSSTLFHFKRGQSLSLEGTWVESKGIQDYELVIEDANDVKIIGDIEETYPLGKNQNTLVSLRDFPSLRHRSLILSSILRLRSLIETELVTFFNSQDFTKVSPPIITSSDCEGAGEQFKIVGSKDFFGREANLTVSSQLHLECLTLALNRAWCLSPCFRAENSNTNRHLSEFYMLEAEICYVTEVSQLTNFVESMIKTITRSLKSKSADLISVHKKEEKEKLQSRWEGLTKEEFWPSITYTEAIQIINKEMLKGRSKGRLAWGDSIQTPHEKWLAGNYYKSPVFITDYPIDVKPFYMPKSKAFDSEKPTVGCFDLILPEIGELVGGSLREHDCQKLTRELEKRNMNSEEIEWYLSLRRNGTVPHGGFGMGFDRLIAYLSGMENLKEVVPFPRVPEECQC